MPLVESLVLLPCHSLEDFPLYHTGAEAQGLLAAWCGLWHPGLIAATGQMPRWARADEPPEELRDRLLVVPAVSEDLLLVGWTQKAHDQGACLVLRPSEPRAVWRQAAEQFSLDLELDPNAPWVRRFTALGFAYLQEELLTRQMRYMSNLDEEFFEAEVVRAAQALARDDSQQAEAHYRQCFELLMESRERYYPVDAYLVDLVLVAETTLGESLRRELRRGRPLNVLCDADTLRLMARREPESLQLLRRQIEAEQVTLVGGTCSQAELPLWPLDLAAAELLRARQATQELLGRPVQVFGQRRFGLCAWLPQLLVRAGFTGALHFPLDEGVFPQATQAKIHWQGVDPSALDALARVPLDSSQAEALLNYCERLGNTMDMDHVATLSFARWPGQASTYFEDLHTAERYSPVLGRFVHLADYFENTELAGEPSRFPADGYRSPYLRHDVAAGHARPVTRFADLYARWAQEQRLAFLHLLGAVLGAASQPRQEEAEGADGAETSRAEEAAVEQAVAEEATQQAAQAVARRMTGQGETSPGVLVLNPWPWPARVEVDVEAWGRVPPPQEGVLAAQSEPVKRLLVEVPGGGYRWVAAASGTAPAARRRKEPPMVVPEEHLLRNEFFQLRLDPETGAIRSLMDYRNRGNRLSQQLALRLPGAAPEPGQPWQDPDQQAWYSVMRAEEIRYLVQGPGLAVAESRGQLLDRQGTALARFTQRVRLWRRYRVFKLEVELEPQRLPEGAPWQSYYACRWAWPDESALLSRGVAGMVFPAEATRLEAPLLVQWETDRWSTTLLCGGLPYHRRVGLRMLDTILLAGQETRRRFELAVGVDLRRGLAEAVNLLAPPVVVPLQGAAPAAGPQAWLFTVEGGQVLTSGWAPLEEDRAERPAGYRVRVLEVLGRPQQVRLRSFRPVKSARQVDLLGNTLAELQTGEDSVLVDLDKYEWAWIEVRFA